MGKNNTRLNPNKEYTLSDIVRCGFFPFAKDIRTVRKIVLADMKGDGVLHAKVSGSGRQTDYRIQGIAIIKFNKVYAPGLMILARKPKTTHGNTNSQKGTA